MKVKDQFEKHVSLIPFHSCHEWTASLSKNGYGRLKINRKQYLAHRIAYELYKGNIPSGMLVCHSCDNRSCVNPNHLWLGTYKNNNDDRDHKGRQGSDYGKGHRNCKLTPEQVTYIRTSLKLQKELASEFNVTQQQISRIKSGKQWAHD